MIWKKVVVAQLCYYSLEGLSNNTKDVSRNIGCPGRDLNRASPELSLELPRYINPVSGAVRMKMFVSLCSFNCKINGTLLSNGLLLLVRIPQMFAQSQDLRGFPHSLDPSTGLVPHIRQRPFPFTYFQINYSFIILPFSTI
jgi:hypothetical protein